MKIMVIDFADSNHLIDILPKELKIIVEKKDGGNAYKTAGEELPEMIFINYKDKPSHGRQTALSIRGRKKTSQIPIYFVDGNEIEKDKVSHLGHCIRSKDIHQFLNPSQQ